jgi:hypothetical protein
LEQDGEAGSEIRWPKRATSASAHVRVVAEARLRVLYCHWLGGEANEMEQGKADAALRV